MRTGGHFTTIKKLHPKVKLRNDIERHTEEFLKAGGVIEEVPGFERVKYVSQLEKDSYRVNAKRARKKRDKENSSLYGREGYDSIDS